MAVLKRPDGEIHYQTFGTGFPVLLFAPGGLRSRMEMWPAPVCSRPGSTAARRRTTSASHHVTTGSRFADRGLRCESGKDRGAEPHTNGSRR